MTQEQQQQQELDHRLANAKTPPAVSNVELASSFIATMIGEQVSVNEGTWNHIYESFADRFVSIVGESKLQGKAIIWAVIIIMSFALDVFLRDRLVGVIEIQQDADVLELGDRKICMVYAYSWA